jgi:hypothetical protein
LVFNNLAAPGDTAVCSFLVLNLENVMAEHSTWGMGPPSAPPDIVDVMVQWFFRNFEDPVQNMPWDEGDYVFIWGGPFYAREELEDVFGAVATPQAIKQAVDKIEEDGGPQWAPSNNRMRPE